jgi:hypothetical protein
MIGAFGSQGLRPDEDADWRKCTNDLFQNGGQIRIGEMANRSVPYDHVVVIRGEWIVRGIEEMETDVFGAIESPRCLDCGWLDVECIYVSASRRVESVCEKAIPASDIEKVIFRPNDFGC